MVAEEPYDTCGGCGMPFFAARDPPGPIGTIVEGIAGGGLGAEFATTVGEPAEPPATPRTRLARKSLG
eukprot:3825546-Alexandrium_andersonii.AAC.1